MSLLAQILNPKNMAPAQKRVIANFTPKYSQVKLKELDVWIRGRSRYCIWKHWNRPKEANEHL